MRRFYVRSHRVAGNGVNLRSAPRRVWVDDSADTAWLRSVIHLNIHSLPDETLPDLGDVRAGSVVFGEDLHLHREVLKHEMHILFR